MSSGNQGLRLTTNRIRSKGNTRRTIDLNKQLKSAFKLSVVNAKRREEKQKKNEKTLKLAASILEKCEAVLRPVDYEGLISSIAELDRSYKAIAKNTALFSTEEEEGEGEKEKGESKGTDEDVQTKRRESSKRREARSSAKKTLSKSQASFKKKLDRFTETIRTIESMKKLMNALKKRSFENERKTKEFKKQLCIDMKSTFDPLFLGSVGYENGPRTDPYGDNLSKSQWDSKTSKT